jgi:hypothetical protein
MRTSEVPETQRMRWSPARWLVALAVAVAALALASWEGTIDQSSATAHVSVLALIAVAIVTAMLTGRGRQRATSADWVRQGAGAMWGDVTGAHRRPPVLVVGTLAWIVLVAATIGWDLTSFVHQAHDLPTLSRVVGDVTRHQWGRALVFAGWLGLGAYVSVGGRRRSRAAVAAGTGSEGAAGTGADAGATTG